MFKSLKKSSIRHSYSRARTAQTLSYRMHPRRRKREREGGRDGRRQGWRERGRGPREGGKKDNPKIRLEEEGPRKRERVGVESGSHRPVS